MVTGADQGQQAERPRAQSSPTITVRTINSLSADRNVVTKPQSPGHSSGCLCLCLPEGLRIPGGRHAVVVDTERLAGFLVIEN